MKSLITPLIALVVGIIIAIAWKKNPLVQVKRELKAIDNAAKMELEMERRGAAVARRDLENQYAEDIAAFDQQQKVQLNELRNDPIALSKWLARVGG